MIERQFTRVSSATGLTHTREMKLNVEDFDAWQSGTLIQDAMPYLSPGDREFLMTGITPEEWDDLFGEER